MFEQHDSWPKRNWVALFGCFCLFKALLNAWNWYVFRKQDDALEAAFNFLTGAAFLLIHRNRRGEEEFREARKELTDALEGRK